MKIYNRRLITGITLIVVIILYSLVSTIFYEGDTSEWYLVQKNLKPSSEFILGSTGLGQEIFYLLSDSILYSLIIGISVAMFSTLLGVIIGCISGFIGGPVDKLLIFFMDAIIAIPSLPILILLASLFKGDFTLLLVCIVLVFFNWPWPARQARAMSLSIKENDFIYVALFSGQSLLNIVFTEIYPHIKNWAFANFINTVLVAIAIETGLAVIGLSSLEDTTLGTMIYWSLKYQAILLEQWFWVGAPVIATIVLFLSLFCLSTGSSDINNK